VRMLIDKKVLLEDTQKGYQATEDAEDVLANVPGTLTGLLMARFDSLDELSHQVLQKAVVLGRSFPVPLLQELCQIPLTTLLPILEELENRLFLRAEDFGRQQGYSFGHTLVRSTIHNTLLRRTRRQLHQQVAEVIEQKDFYSNDDRIEALGYHYSESNIPHKAIPYLVLSAENAFVRGAHETALNSYRRCVAIAPGQETGLQEEYVRIRLGMGRTLKFLGDLNEAVQRLQEAVDNLEQNKATSPEALTSLIEAMTELGDAHLRAGQSDEAWKRLNAAQAQLQNRAASTIAGASHLWTALLDRMAWARLREGDLNEAISLAQEALDGSETTHNKNPGLLASLYNILGGVYYQKGIPARAVQYVRMSLNLYESLDYSWGVASTLSNLGVLYYAQGLWSEAAEYYERAETIRREHGFAAERALNLYNLALLRSTMGMHSQAIEIFESCLTISQRLGDHKVIGCCYIGLGQLAEIEERVEDLNMYVEKASTYLGALGDDHKTHLCLLQAQLEKHLGHFESAIEIATSALDIAEKAGLSEEIVDTHRVLGTLYRAAGDYLQSEKALRYSLQISQERNDPHHQGLAELELARLLPSLPPPNGLHPKESCHLGRDMLVRAAGHFEQVGAIYFLGVAQEMLNRHHTHLVPSAYIDA
jgi:tetratricopeptide (TPR) repeat protein